MKLKPFKRMPVLVALGIIVLVSFLRCFNPDVFDRLERMTFDMRARAALHHPLVVATNLGFLFINEESVKRVADGSLGFNFGLYWPRQVYGRVVQELAFEGARATAFDVLFGELRPDHPLVQMEGGGFMESDEFFATQMSRAGNVIVAVTPQVTPPDLFLTNAFAAGDIGTEKDSDGILRRALAFRSYRRWHPAFRQMEADADYGVDLHQARIESRRIVLRRQGLDDINIPLDAEGKFDVADFWGDKLPPGIARKARPFTEERVWHMGLVLAARALGLDLSQAAIDLPGHQITLHGPNGLVRTIPVDERGYFYIDWCMQENHPLLTREPVHALLAQSRLRFEGKTNELSNPWRDKLVLIGSSGVVGNNLTDRGATPVRDDTLLAGEHWNVANSLLTGRFVRRSSTGFDLGLIFILGAAAAAVTWQLRVLVASGVVALVVSGYAIAALELYVRTRYWLPLVYPLAGAVLMTHVSLVTWRVVFEQAERRRIKSFFSTLVSPKIVEELLQADKLSLEGVRREVTVFFADLRGFTEFTDASQERVAEHVREHHLEGRAAELCFDEQARQTLESINQYLGIIADTIVERDGTLDKFIGDCVMAFWGAPTVNPRHAVTCVLAAIDAQRAIYDFNRGRYAENQRRQAENQARLAAGQPALALLPILFVGTGINTGMATVGIMGAEARAVVRQGNYTVFGREVNLASRLEGASGRGRIFISRATYEHLKRQDPALAGACLSLPALQVKGIRSAVEIYEVPWRMPGSPSLEEEFAGALGETPALAPRNARERLGLSGV